MNDAQAQACLDASPAPRVTLDDIEDRILAEHYFTAAEGAQHPNAEGRGFSLVMARPGGPLSLLTFCVLVLENGYTVTGESACASPENFNAELGRHYARRNAVQKIWPLEGYLLREKLAGIGSDEADERLATTDEVGALIASAMEADQ